MEPRALLANLMKAQGLNPTSLSRKTNGFAKQPQIYRFLDGTSAEPRRSTMEPIARHFRVPVEAFYDPKKADEAWAAFQEAGSEPASPEISLINNPDYPSIRRVSFKLSAGVTGQPTEYVEDDEDLPPIVFQRQWYALHGYRPDRLLAAKVNGTSMEPTLFDGDLVVVNTASAEPKDGKAFALNYEGVLSIKRLVRDAGEWLIRSDNPDKIRHPDKRTHEGVSLIGEIVHRQSDRI